jgi:electron transport complex protein RnfD
MPEHKNILINKPQINISYTSSSRMWLVSLCFFLCVIQSAVNDGGITLILVIAALFSAIITEFLLTWRLYGVEKIKDGSAVVTALILSALLPNQIHPVYAVLGAIFAIAVIKYSFGGLGANWLNPALGGWLFIRFSWSEAFLNTIEKGSTSIGEINIGSNISVLGNFVTEVLNNSIFSFAGINLPIGYVDLLVKNSSSIIADRGLFFLLLGTIVVTAAGINRGWIPLVFLLTYGFLIRLAGDISGLFWNGDVIYGFFSGGTIVAAFILVAEPSSSAKTNTGIAVIVVLSAVLSWLFRYRFMEYSGCFIALAVINCFSPLIKLIEEKVRLSLKNNVKTREIIL